MPALNLLRSCVFITLLAAFSPEARAQVHDQEVSWSSYEVGSTRSARVRVFASESEQRPHTVIVDDRASNGEMPITDEAPFVAEVIAREIGFDPTKATFVFRFTHASWDTDGDDDGKALLVRATFRRTSGGSLGAPTWHLLTPEALEDLTDRQMR